MVYKIAKVLVRLGLFIFFKKIFFQDRAVLNQKGPLLLACNHPNSFLDALILGTYFDQPIHFLARGDAFKNPFAKKLLTALKVIPIYRLREGKEYLALNDATFERCIEILLEGGIVLIFSEGLCINQWKLRLLKKGTARIALNAWKKTSISAHFHILPVSLNYSSFHRFRKSVVIKFGALIKQGQIPKEKTEGEQIMELNKIIYARLQNGLIIEEDDVSSVEFVLTNCLNGKAKNKDIIPYLGSLHKELTNRFFGFAQRLQGAKQVALSKFSLVIALLLITVLFLPAAIGFLIHFPLFYPVKKIIKIKTAGTVFYHSALFGVLIIAYPIYTFCISILLSIVFENIAFLLCVGIFPVLAFIFLLWLDCVERVVNYWRLSKTTKQFLKIRMAKEG